MPFERLYKPPMNPMKLLARELALSLRDPCFCLRGSARACCLRIASASAFERFPSRIAYAGSFSHAARRTVQDDVDDSEENDEEELPSRVSAAWRCCSYCKSKNMLATAQPR